MRDSLFVKYVLVKNKNSIGITIWLCLYNISIALFLLKYPQYMITRIHPLFEMVPPNILPIGLVLSSILLLISVFLDISGLRLWTTRAISFFTGGIFAMSLMYHLGAGFPDITWIHYLFSTIMSLMMGYKQRYKNRG